VAPLVLLYLVSLPLLSRVSSHLSHREFAAAIARAVGDDTRVAAVSTFPLSLPFYLRQPVELFSRNGHELTSNYLKYNFAQWARPGNDLRPLADFPAELRECARPTIFVIHDRDHAPQLALVREELPLVARSDSFSAYGPCRRAATRRD
jgi:hypothetical protein